MITQKQADILRNYSEKQIKSLSLLTTNCFICVLDCSANAGIPCNQCTSFKTSVYAVNKL